MKATVQQRAGLEAFADPKSRPDQLAAGGLAAHEDKYDFKSENVIELLKQLKLKFEDDKLAGTKAETNAINAYDLTKEASDNAHKAASKARDEKEVELKDTKVPLQMLKKEIKSTQDDLEADSASLKDTESACTSRSPSGRPALRPAAMKSLPVPWPSRFWPSSLVFALRLLGIQSHLHCQYSSSSLRSATIQR